MSNTKKKTELKKFLSITVFASLALVAIAVATFAAKYLIALVSQ